jgi:O-antigen/teichoic acid export membrane protein
MMRTPSFLRHAAIYSAGNLLLQAAGFLLLPIYVRCLSEAEYGTLEVLNRVGEVLAIFLLGSGLRQALFTFHGQSHDEAERRQVVGTLLTLTGSLLLTGGTLLLLLAGPVSGWLKSANDPGLLRLAVVTTLLEGLTLLLLALAQARQESIFFTAVSLAQFFLRVGVSIVLVVGLGWGIRGVLLATACTSGLFAVFLLGREVARGGVRPNRIKTREMLSFALPFLPGALGYFILNSGDRFFLNQHASLDQVGAYSLGYKLALVVPLFSRTPLYMVWSARMYEAARLDDAPETFGRVFTRITGAYVFVGLGLCLFAGEGVRLLTGSHFGHAARIIPPVVLGYFFLTTADLMDAGFYVRRRTGPKTAIMLSSAVMIALLYQLLIPSLGGMGAALATLSGFIFHSALTRLVSQRIFPVRYEPGRVAAMLGLAIGLWLVSRLLPFALWAVPLKVGLLLAWPTILWWTGLVSEEEKETARNILRGIFEFVSRFGKRAEAFVPSRRKLSKFLPSPLYSGERGRG